VASVSEYPLGAELEAVPQARRFTAAALAAEGPGRVQDAELIVTELVTNALLHAGLPATLRISRRGSRVRIEVEDAGRQMPVMGPQNTETMTGRGLSLVATLADGWGIDPSPGGGKIVWAELRGDAVNAALVPEVDVEALLSSWRDDEPPEPLFTVRIGSVPTDLLLAAKAHIDNVVREFTLARAGGRSVGEDLPPALLRLTETVTKGFASARAEIKRQAVAAAARGDEETDLVLTQPASAADAGEAYLAALDETDRYARAARLLTLETPAVHRVFRRWYVLALVDQLRARANGRPPPRVRTFPQVLADEVTHLATMREAADRLQLLQKVTAELTRAGTVEDIAVTVTRNAREFLGALASRVYLLGDDGVLRSIACHGGTTEWTEQYQEIPLSADLPGPVVLRSGRAMVLRNLAQIGERFPTLRHLYGSERSLHVAPLVVDEHRIGILSLAFPIVGPLDERDQAAFVGALADTLAQALERALGLHRASEANEKLSAANARLGFLAEASVALSGSLDYQATLDAVAALMVPRLADGCVIQVLEAGELRTLAVRYSDPTSLSRAQNLRDRHPAPRDARTGPAHVARTGRSELHATISDAFLAQIAVDAEHLQVLRTLDPSSALVVPLIGWKGVLGTVTLVYAGSGRHYSEGDVPFLEDLARRAGLAVEAAAAFRDQSGRLATISRVAEAAQHAILAPPPARIGPVALAARYTSAAADALIGGDLYEVVTRPGSARLLIGDVRGKGLAAVRTATVVLGEFRAAAADIDDLGAVSRQLDRRLRPYLGDEDFVTALVAEIHDDGRFAVASCGHPPALLCQAGTLRWVPMEHSLPLGLGADPPVAEGRLELGDRLLLYTDGVVEARDSRGEFVDLIDLAGTLAAGDLEDVLDDILGKLRAVAGAELGDDLALLVAEYRGTAD
jgi:serine phosphatase RsbU (regulator of sigma subunit)/anti-sigma regulatory factor (Ser/Thr protein kinase)